MHIAFAVFFLLIAHVVSYPAATDNEESDNDLQLEIRSILNHLDNQEMMDRSVESDEGSREDNSEQDENAMKKRQGGYNVVQPGMKCEIECVDQLRNPPKGQGMSIKDAAKACKNMCANAGKKREEQSHQKNLREFTDDDDSKSNEKQLREFSNYLKSQLNDNE